ncbi:hypothetical protein [Lactococcus garvieae]|nr:hypothetical protein [Lactococcus garvieae]
MTQVKTTSLIDTEYLYNLKEDKILVKEGTPQERINEILEEVHE